MYEENSGLHGGDAFSMDDQNDITAAIAAASAAEMELQLYHEIEQYYFNAANMHFHHHQPQQHIPAAETFNQMLLPNPPAFLGDASHYGGAAAYDPSTPLNQPPLLRESKRNSNTSEKQRRAIFGNKYETLKSLLPGPTKKDRASILSEAISFINELKRTETELKILVQNKKKSIERNKRPKEEVEEEECVGDMNPCNGSSLRSSWLHRKSKHVEVDVKIIDDEITVKLVHQKRISCSLLFVSEALDELGLDLHHVSGGVIGDFSSYLLNSKICEGSIVFASAVANKIIEVVDKQFDAVPPTISY